MNSTISIIIPALNEERNLRRTLAPLAGNALCEVIVADGGSGDGTLALARNYGCRTCSGPSNRSHQMNLGANTSSGSVLLFLHADTLLPENFCQAVQQALAREDVAAGAFSLSFDSDAKAMAIIARAANLRSRLFQLPYGDQGIFTLRSRFMAVGGFPDMEIMEDFVFVRKMQRQGKVITLDENVTTSARRWENIGILRTSLINQLIIFGHCLGVSPATLARWYQRVRGVDSKSFKNFR